MKPFRFALAPSARGVSLLIALLFLLSACGGGGSADVVGVGSGGSGVASGSVSGFGSIFVDGIEYADSSASHQAQDASGASVNVAVKLGQRVRVVYAATGQAQSVEVQAQLAGPVTLAPGSDGRLTVLGQPVRIVSGNGDTSLSSPTVLDGYASMGGIAAGDEVEVHGSWVFDSSVASNVLVATRIEKLAAQADPVLLAGVVMAVEAGGLRLNAANGVRVTAPNLPVVTLGEVVRAWVARSVWGSSPLVALRVAGLGLSVAELAAQGSARVSGLASNYDAASGTVMVQGLRVQLPSGADGAALARGEFVTVELNASAGGLVAKAVDMRGGGGTPDLGRTVTVKGVLRGIDWTAPSVSFVLRDTAITAAAAAIDASCRTVSAVSDVYVVVNGTLAPAGNLVAATTVVCTQSFSGPVEASFTATLLTIDVVGRSMSLGLVGGGVLAASWDDQTYFEQRPAVLPVGLRVEVEGVLDKGSSTLRLSELRLAN